MATTNWRVDGSHSNVEFAVKHLMISTVRGRFTDVDGTVAIDDAEISRSRVEVSIKTASIDTRNADRDTHLRSPDFFDAEKFPTVAFRSTRVERTGAGKLRVSGDLTIHGVTKAVALDVSEEGRGKDPWGGERAGFSSSLTIDRRPKDPFRALPR